VSRQRELLAALTQASAGGYLSALPGLDGEPGLGLVGIHGVPRGRTWDTVVSASSPDLPGETVTFVVLEDGTIVVDGDVPDGALEPLAEELDRSLGNTYRAAAMRHEGDLWTAVAEKVEIVELPMVEEDEVELTIVDGERTLKLDGEPTIRPLPALDALAEEHGDVSVHAERVDGHLFAVDVYPL
jgi:hypothetical protein